MIPSKLLLVALSFLNCVAALPKDSYLEKRLARRALGVTHDPAQLQAAALSQDVNKAVIGFDGNTPAAGPDVRISFNWAGAILYSLPQGVCVQGVLIATICG